MLSALALVLSTASANRLLGFFPRLYSLLAFLPDPDDGRAGASFAKWRTKVAGRIALLRLQHRDAEGSVPKEVEVIVGELLHGLSHPVSLVGRRAWQQGTEAQPDSQDTVPRYSAAKYLARLALQMPPDSAVEVMVAVLDVFEDALGEDARKAGEVKVQGACLAVGEMTRRGLLARLPAEDRSEVMQRVLDYSLKVCQRRVPASFALITSFSRLCDMTTSTRSTPSGPRSAILPPTLSGRSRARCPPARSRRTRRTRSQSACSARPVSTAMSACGELRVRHGKKLSDAG